MNKKKMNSAAKGDCSSIFSGIRKGTWKENDAPRVVVACSVKSDAHHCKIGRNGPARLVDYIPKMVNALSVLGKVGDKSRFGDCVFPIGQCAEPHAANEVLREKCNRGFEVADLSFSNAYRPRTKHTVDQKGRKLVSHSIERTEYCNNCKRVFHI